MARRVQMWPVVLVVGIILVAACAGWAVLVELRVPDVCSDGTQVPKNVGPVECPYWVP